MWEWPVYGAATGVLLWAGYPLSAQADALGARRGWTRNWAGLVMLATVTSMPELFTGISAVAFANAPRIALGDMAGSLALNMLVVGVCTTFGWIHLRPMGVQNLPSARYATGMGGLVFGLFALAPVLGDPLAGLILLPLPLVYLFVMRRIYRLGVLLPVGESHTRGHLGVFLWYAGWVVAAASVLPFAGQAIARSTGVSDTFVGGLLVAGSTSLPEVAITVAALRLGAPELALASLLGSNLIDVAILGLDELAYPGALLTQVAVGHLWLTGAASAMMALVWWGLARLGPRGDRGVGVLSIALYAAAQAAAYLTA